MIAQRTWDQVDMINFNLVNENNIFKEGTFEAILVNQVIVFYKLHSKEMNKSFYSLPSYKYHFENKLSNQILEFLAQENIAVPMDLISKNYLGQRACWYARLSGCLEAKDIRPNKQVPLFGLYLESGVLDLIKEHNLLNTLIKTSPTRKGLDHLIHVAKISSAIRQLFRLPTARMDNSLKHEERYRNINFTNINIKDTQSLNFQTWPDIENIEVGAKTRGIFHHLGDEMAFMLSAVEYGDFCILGSDEFGDLVPMYYYSYNDMDIRTFKSKVVFSWRDFDYIYGVPRINGMYPTPNNVIFQYVSDNKNQSKINDMNNSVLSEEFWNNQIFKNLCGRDIRLKSLNEIAVELKKCVEDALFQYKSHPFFSENDSIYDCFSRKISTTKENKQLYVTKFSNVEKDFFELINSSIRKNFSFFIKTTAHKVNCAVVNPRENTEMAFFKKSGDSKAIRYVDLSSMLNFFINQKPSEILGGIDIEFYQRFFIYFLLGDNPQGFWEIEDKNLYKYWLNIEAKAFVVSNLVEMRNEYRMFIVNGKIAATTACYRNTTPFNAWTMGRIDPRLCDGHNATECVETQDSRNIVAKYARFARKFIKMVKQDNSNILSYVLDVCLSKDKDGKDVVIPIEVNSINMSGAYQADMRKLCAAVADKSLQVNALNDVFNLDLLNDSPVDFISDLHTKFVFINKQDVSEVIQDVYEQDAVFVDDMIEKLNSHQKHENEDDEDDFLYDESVDSDELSLSKEQTLGENTTENFLKDEDDTENFVVNLTNQNKNEKM